MASVVNLSAKVSGDASGFLTMVDRVRESIKKMEKDARRGWLGVGGSAFRLLVGSGVTSSLGLIGSHLERTTGQLRDQSIALRTYRKNWHEARQEMLESLPLFGSFAKAGANIWELLSSMEAGKERAAMRAEALGRGATLSHELRAYVAAATGRADIERQERIRAEHLKLAEALTESERRELIAAGYPLLDSQHPEAGHMLPQIHVDKDIWGRPNQWTVRDIRGQARSFLHESDARAYLNTLEQPYRTIKQRYHEMRTTLEFAKMTRYANEIGPGYLGAAPIITTNDLLREIARNTNGGARCE